MKPTPPLWHNQAILSEAKIALHGDVSELETLAIELARFCGANTLGPDVEFDLNLVLEEFFTNTVRHGGCKGMDNAAEVRLKLAPDGVLVDYRDRGTPFNPLNAPEPDLDAPLEMRQAGGLGMHLARQIMRDLAYQREGEWNRTTMRRPAEPTSKQEAQSK